MLKNETKKVIHVKIIGYEPQIACTSTDHEKSLAKFQNDVRKTGGGVAHTRYLPINGRWNYGCTEVRWCNDVG